MRSPPTAPAENTVDWTADVVDRTVRALRPLADTDRAAQIAAYMKHIALFHGVPALERRQALRTAWTDAIVLSRMPMQNVHVDHNVSEAARVCCFVVVRIRILCLPPNRSVM